MKNVSYISAGAGSGKTHKLTHIVADMIASGEVQPEQIILTTFSNDAAAELRERAKGVLFEQGKYTEAMRLDQAIIGTIHAMANKFIQRYWYLLGISPELNVISEEDTDFYISQSLAKLPSDADLELFNEFVDKYNVSKSKTTGWGYEKNYNFWKDHLKSVIEKSRSFNIIDFTKSCAESKSWLLQFVNPNATFDSSDNVWIPVMEELNAEIPNMAKGNADKIAKLDAVKERRNFDWYNDFCSAVTGLPKKNSKNCPNAVNIYAIINDLFTSNSIYQDQADYIDTIFRLAAKWQQEYVQYKKDHQLIDYNDMEMYLLRLFDEHSEILGEIGNSYKCLLVDEFQDSSISQVKIFSAISDHVGKTYFCGDQKQAIYSFRGGNPELIQAVTDYIKTGKNGCSKEDPLDTSYRSTPEIVDVVNNVFTPVFGRYGMDKNDVELKQNNPTVYADKTLRYWTYEGSKDGNYYRAIGARIKQMMDDGEISSYSDVAVLGNSHAELDATADAFKSLGLPVNSGSGNIAECKETELLFSVLNLFVNKNDTLSKCKIAYLTEEGWTLNRIIDEKLAYDKAVADAVEKEENVPSFPLDYIPLVKETLAVAAELKKQSIASIVKNSIIRLRLLDIVKLMDQSALRMANLQSLCRYAQEYEDHCVRMTQAATIDGFVDYIKLMECKASGDPDGIVVKTYHSSKGLQWKVVILTSLNKGFTSESDFIKKGIYGVQTTYLEQPSTDNFYPECIVTLLPWIMGTKDILPAVYSTRIKGLSIYNQKLSTTIQEQTRLMYVGMTRARDMLVLVGQGKNNQLKWFDQIHVKTSASSTNVLGTIDVFIVEKLAAPAEELLITESKMQQTIFPQNDIEYLPRNIKPSADHSDLGIVKILTGKSTFGRILSNAKEGDEAAVGNCLHQIYCDIDCPNPAVMAKEVISQRQLVSQLPDAEAVIASYKHMAALLTELYGSAENVYREMQFKHFVDGRIVNGSIDLAWETSDGIVLVDYKTFHGKREYITNPEHPSVYAGRYKLQLDYYANALTASGKKVLARLIYYPVIGTLVEIKP